ncbi:MAG: hypothetical protein ACRC92_18165, partial [Peptostreptococcaceae bacterium]
MNILKNEIKKIFNLRSIVILGIMSIMIWYLFIYSEIEYFPNGFPASGSTDLSIEILNKYGLTMNEEEFKDFKKTRKEREKVADKFLQSYEDLIKKGINSYKEFEEYENSRQNDNSDSELEALVSKIIFEDDLNGNQILWELEGRDYFIERYENKESWINGYNTDAPKILDKYEQVISSGEYGSPMYFRTIDNYDALIWWVNILILISVAFMISPIFLNDNKNKINYIQYSSKTGRKLYSKKLLAGVISAIIIITIQLAVLFTLYRANNTYPLWDCGITSAFSDRVSWFDITFGQYIILSVVLTYIIGITVAIISMSISSKVNSYISLIGYQVPIIFVIGGFLKY